MRRPSVPLRLLSAAFATALLGVAPSLPAGASARSHCLVGFDGYQPPASATEPYYFAPEGQSVGVQVKTRSEVDCQTDPDLGVTYRTVEGSAVAPEDYTAQDDTIQVSGGTGIDTIPLADDSGDEPVVETFQVQAYETDQPWLFSGTNPVTAHIIDLDGTTRVAFRGSTLVQSETKSSVHIPVFMGGPIPGPVSVQFTVSPGTSGDPAEPADFNQPASTTLTFSASARVQPIQFSLNNDTLIENAETINVSLQTGAGYELASPNTLVLTIQDNDRDFVAPTAWFHHPRHGRRYQYGTYRLREMHVFTSDQGTPASGVVAVELALRKKKLNGSCTWWNAGKWVAGSCSAKRWLPMQFDFDLWLRRFPPLPRSVGTSIKNYTAWCRATDGAGNVQTSFVHDRTGTKAKGDGNWSTFEVE